MVIKPKELRGGKELNSLMSLGASDGESFTLDLSEVIFGDSTGFKFILNIDNFYKKVIPLKDPYTIERYNDWLESKKIKL